MCRPVLMYNLRMIFAFVRRGRCTLFACPDRAADGCCIRLLRRLAMRPFTKLLYTRVVLDRIISRLINCSPHSQILSCADLGSMQWRFYRGALGHAPRIWAGPQAAPFVQTGLSFPCPSCAVRPAGVLLLLQHLSESMNSKFQLNSAQRFRPSTHHGLRSG